MGPHSFHSASLTAAVPLSLNLLSHSHSLSLTLKLTAGLTHPQAHHQSHSLSSPTLTHLQAHRQSQASSQDEQGKIGEDYSLVETFDTQLLTEGKQHQLVVS
ncbi:hypothetical protein ACB092_12G139300 [Castanea dentata]